MTLSLFGSEELDVQLRPRPKSPAAVAIKLAIQSEETHGLARSLPPSVYLGTSSWTFPGWAGLVWDQPYAETKLSKDGLHAYSQHPLLRTVSLDRAFYRPMTVAHYAKLASQVSDDFRFVVKVPSMISDALIRRTEGDGAGQGLQSNPHFLDASLFQEVCLQPVLQGLGGKLGALVLQMSPLPVSMLSKSAIFKLFEALAGILSAQSAIKYVVADAILAIELRNAELIQTPYRDALIALLKSAWRHLLPRRPRQDAAA
ncbi:MAG: DUF72 domain-containing protein [Brachymonas sp.]|nr:DUF72 domain-containing protein [Brachymonas sp.]